MSIEQPSIVGGQDFQGGYDPFDDDFYNPFEDNEYREEQITLLEKTLPKTLLQKIEYVKSNHFLNDALAGNIPIGNIIDFIEEVAETGKIEYIFTPREFRLLFGIVFQDTNVSPKTKVACIESFIDNSHPNVVQAVFTGLTEEAIESANDGKYYAEASALLECVRAASTVLMPRIFQSNAHFGAMEWMQMTLRNHAELPETNYLLGLRMRLVAEEKISLQEDPSGYGVDYDFSNDYRVFRMSRDRYGVFREEDGNLFVSDSKDLDDIMGYEEVSNEEKERIVREKHFSLHLLTPKELHFQNEKPQSSHDDDFNAYIMIQREKTQEFLRNDFHCDIRDLSLAEQYQFLRHLRKQSNQSVRNLQKNTQKYDIVFMRSFLSLEQGGEEMGEVILSIGENLPQNEADAIFQRYAELVDIAEGIAKGNESEQSHQNKEKEVLHNIATHILEKAKNMLVETADALKEEKAVDSESIAIILEEYREDIIRTSAMCRSLPHDTPLEAIEGLTFEKRSAQKYAEYTDTIKKLARGEKVSVEEEELTEITDLRQIFQMIDRNYVNRGEFRAILKQGLAETLLTNAENTTLYFVRQNERILALARFEDRGDSMKYFGSFNVLTSAQQSSIAPRFFRRIIEEEGKESDIEATCDAFSTASGIYIEQGNFITETIDDRQETPNRIDEKPWFHIRRTRDQHQEFSFYQKKSLEDLHELYREQAHRETGEPLLSRKTFLLYLPMEELRDETSQSYTVIKNLLNIQHYSLTRFVRDGSSGFVFCALERGSDEGFSDVA